MEIPKIGEDTLSLLNLLQRAATHKGLKIPQGASTAYSEPIKEYVLDDKLLVILAKCNIRREHRPDCAYEITTLVDENPQEKVPGWLPSNSWNFKLLQGDRKEFDLRIALSAGFGINLKKRGVMLVPRAFGPFVSASDNLPNFRMFKALVENDADAPSVAKELAESDGTIMVTWTELGLGGIRRLIDLFREFTGDNDTVEQLAKNNKVFDPAPFPRYQEPGDELFIPEPAQPKIFEMWQAQLMDYRARLVT